MDKHTEAVELSDLIRAGSSKATALGDRARWIAESFEVLGDDPTVDEAKRALTNLFYALNDIDLITNEVMRAYKSINDAIGV